MTALFISREDLVRHTPLSGNIDMDKVLHFVKIAQDIHVQGLLGTPLYDRIQTDILANNLTGDYLSLVNTYVKPVLIQYTFLEFLPFAQYTLGNKGVFKKTSENGDNPSVEEVDRMKEATRDTAEHYARRLADHLRHYAHDLYTEYLTAQKDEIHPQRDITFGGWNI